MGLQGTVRGRQAKTTASAPDTERPADRVNQDFTARRPDALWGSDCPRLHGSRVYVATWRGFVYTALVIDAHARRIPAFAGTGWRVSGALGAERALDALEQALHARDLR